MDPSRSLKTAILRVYTPGCAFEFMGAEFERCVAALDAAPREHLLAAYADVVSDPMVDLNVVYTVTSLAAKLPLHPGFREALRNRRDQLARYERRLPEVFDYLAIHGEWSDIDWLWATAENCDENNRLAAFAAIKKLVRRVNAQGE